MEEERIIELNIDDVKRALTLKENELMRSVFKGRYYDIRRKNKELLIKEVI